MSSRIRGAVSLITTSFESRSHAWTSGETLTNDSAALQAATLGGTHGPL